MRKIAIFVLIVLVASYVSADSLRDEARQELAKSEALLGVFEQNISAYPSWVRKSAEKHVSYTSIKSSISRLKNDYDSAISDDDYSKITLELEGMDIPSQIYEIDGGTAPLIVGGENFEVSVLEEISFRDVDDAELRRRVSGWMGENTRAVTQFFIIAATIGNKSESIATGFSIDLGLDEGSDAKYIVISYPFNEIEFATSYGQKSSAGGAYIPIESSTNLSKIEFSIAESVSVEEIGAYISPEMSALGSFGTTDDGLVKVGQKFYWGAALTSVIVIVIIAVLGYLAISWWYRYRYEKHLFKNSRDLANITGFIHSMRARQASDGEIRKKLKAAHWTIEQINYAIEKIKHPVREDDSGARFIKSLGLK